MAQAAHGNTLAPATERTETRRELRIPEGVWIAGAVILGLTVVISFYVVGLITVAHLRFLGEVFNV